MISRAEDNGAPDRDRARWRRWIPPAPVMLCFVVYLCTASGRLGTWDADLYFTVTDRLVTHGRVDVPAEMIMGHEEWKGRGGLYYAPFDLGQSLINVPFYLAGHFVAGVVANNRDESSSELVTRGAVAMGNVVAVALCVWVVWATAGVLGWGRRGQTGTALLFGLGTMAWPYATVGFNQAWAMLGQTIGLLGVVRYRASRRTGDAIMAGLGTALGMAVRMNVALAVPWYLLGLWACDSPGVDGGGGRRRWGALVGYLLPVGAAAGLALAYNWIRFGTVARGGYSGDPNTEFDIQNMPILLFALTASPAKGVLLYVPLTVLAARGWVKWVRSTCGSGQSSSPVAGTQSRLVAPVFAGVIVTYLLFFSAMAYGHSGLHSWGPRFLVPLMPLIGLLAWSGLEGLRRPTTRVVASLVVGVSVAIQFLAVSSDQGERMVALSNRLGGTGFYEDGFFTLRGQMIVDRVTALGEKAGYWLAGKPAPAPELVDSETPGKDLVLSYSHCLNFWWCYAGAMRLAPWGFFVLAGALCAGILVLLFRRCWRDLRGTPETT